MVSARSGRARSIVFASHRHSGSLLSQSKTERAIDSELKAEGMSWDSESVSVSRLRGHTLLVWRSLLKNLRSSSRDADDSSVLK